MPRFQALVWITVEADNSKAALARASDKAYLASDAKGKNFYSVEDIVEFDEGASTQY